jgi:dihydroorotase
VDTPQAVRYILQRARRAPVRVYPVAAITKGLQGQEFTDFAALRAAGAVAVSDDGRPVADRARMGEAMRLAAENGLRVASHCEDLSIIDGGILHKGAVSEQLGVKGMDRRSEDEITERECALALETGAPVHICHVSTAGAVEAVRRAKAAGAPVTCETGAHYLMLTDRLLLTRDADYRMNPPLREQADCDAVCQGLVDGTIDCIITDHAPHSPEEKADFLHAPNGVVGLETSLAGCITALVETGRLSLSQLIARMAVRPRQIMGLPGGSLRPGEAADLTLFDPKQRWTVDPERFYSRSRNTPFKGMELTGRVKYTFLAGRITYMDQE